MSMFLLPYKRGPQGSRALAEALGIRRIKLERSRFRATADKIILNWGNTIEIYVNAVRELIEQISV